MFFVTFASAPEPEKNQELEQYYHRYKETMFRLAWSILYNVHDAEEAVQEVFLKLIRNHLKFWEISDEAARKNYLLSAVKNTAINTLKKNGQTIPLEEVKAVRDLEKLKDQDFEEMILSHFEYEEVMKAIQTLDYIYQEVMYYHFGLGLTIKETAKLLGRKPGTVNIQLVRGKKKLLEIIRKGEKKG